MTPSLRIYLVAGESSGDVLGARLMQALQNQTGGDVEFSGVGGPEMQSEGLRSLFPMEELSVMGIVEILPHAKKLMGRMREVAGEVERLQPSALVTIDAPAFAHGVAKRVHGVPKIHYVAPQLWAWRPWRIGKFRRHFDHLLALLPFEPAWFEARNMPCRFVGHPVLESGADKGDGAAFRRRYDIDAEAPVLCCLLGSRRGEVARHAEPFREAIRLVAAAHPHVVCVYPTVPHLADRVAEMVEDWPGRSIVLRGAAEKFDAMQASNAALAASGTVALELAMARVPTVIGYRTAPVTYWFARRLINVDYAHIVNLILNRAVVPERLQNDCTGEILAEDLLRLMGPDGVSQIENVAPGLAALGADGDSPSKRAAAAVLDIISDHRAKK